MNSKYFLNGFVPILLAGLLISCRSAKYDKEIAHEETQESKFLSPP